MGATLTPTVRFLLRFSLSVYRFIALRVAWMHRHLTGRRGSYHEERVMSGRAWDEFCDTLKAAGASVVAPGAPRDAFNQAEGYRYLARLARAGLENFLECADVESPRLCAIANGSRDARVCIGSDNPDNLYENAMIDGTLAYVVKITRGTVGYLGFGTQSGQYGGKGGLQTVAYLEAGELVADDESGESPAEQRYTIVLSAEPPAEGGNWLRLQPEPREAMFIVRQTFGDRTKETPASVRIFRRDMHAPPTSARRRTTRSAAAASASAAEDSPPPAPLTAEKLDNGLQQAGVLVAGASAMFAKWAKDFRRHENLLPLFDQERSNKAGGDPNIRYYHSYWRLDEGQVLRIRARPPPCRCWNFQLNNHWMESLDYRHHTVHTNSSLARADDAEQEQYTILVCADDPNADGTFRGNWLETTGHAQGTMCFRWIAPRVTDEELPHPFIEVVSSAEVLASR